MPGAIITVDGLGKRYRMGGRRGSYFTLRDSLAGAAGRVAGLLRGAGLGAVAEEFWALRDVSFEVRPGEVVGVIGRNGAGKSTLLKILSRITEPTEGRAILRGRVGSLLEVGTGFHPELTGRENIYLSGAILGMRKAEIDRKFDEIVAFAGVEKFLDTATKHYSSGMGVRLGFAVAAHLDPEILLVDEVLAVGDAEFQRKCLGKMGEVARGGRTILFVSHNMMAVQNLCQSGCVLDGGRVAYLGGAAEAVRVYMDKYTGSSVLPIGERKDRRGNGGVRLTEFSIAGPGGPGAVIRSGDRLRVSIGYESGEPLEHPQFLVGMYDPMGVALFRLDSQVTGGLPDRLPPRGTVVCETGSFDLTPGVCSVNVAVTASGALADHVVEALVFSVEPGDFYATGRSFRRDETVFLLRQQWAVRG